MNRPRRLLPLSPRPAETWHDCAGCGESFTWLHDDDLCEDCAVARARERQIEALPAERASYLGDSRVPRRYARMEFIPPRRWPTDRRGGSLETWDGEPWAIVLAGEVGTGKTMLAIELLWRRICREVVEGRRRGRHLFIRGSEIPGLMFGSRGGLSIGDLDRLSIHEVARAETLVVDDLGAGISGEAWQALDRLLGPRYDEELPTIFTSNVKLQALSQVHDSGARIADRLTDGLVVTLSGDSRRGWRPDGEATESVTRASSAWGQGRN